MNSFQESRSSYGVCTIADNGYPRLNNILDCRRRLTNHDFAAAMAVFASLRAGSLDAAADVLRDEQLAVGSYPLGRFLHPRVGSVPILQRKTHRIAIVLEPKLEDSLAVAFGYPLANEVLELLQCLLVSSQKQVLYPNAGSSVCEVEVVEELVKLGMLVLGGGGGLGGVGRLRTRVSQGLLLLDILGKVAEGLNSNKVSSYG